MFPNDYQPILWLVGDQLPCQPKHKSTRLVPSKRDRDENHEMMYSEESSSRGLGRISKEVNRNEKRSEEGTYDLLEGGYECLLLHFPTLQVTFNLLPAGQGHSFPVFHWYNRHIWIYLYLCQVPELKTELKLNQLLVPHHQDPPSTSFSTLCRLRRSVPYPARTNSAKLLGFPALFPVLKI